MEDELNVGGVGEDAFYRYKRSAVKSQVLGGWTQVDNLDVIAGELCRPVDELWKYISLTLSTTATPKKNRLNGKIDQSKIEAAVMSYIDGYVKCGKCGNPETVYKRVAKGVRLVCAACGGETECGESKMTKYIMNRG